VGAVSDIDANLFADLHYRRPRDVNDWCVVSSGSHTFRDSVFDIALGCSARGHGPEPSAFTCCVGAHLVRPKIDGELNDADEQGEQDDSDETELDCCRA
jgi:hypothetical protein